MAATKPTHTAYQVREFKSGGEDRSSCTRIGSAWAHGDGKGFNIRLHATPIDGEIVLRTVQEQKQTDDGDDAEIKQTDRAEAAPQARPLMVSSRPRATPWKICILEVGSHLRS